MSLPCKHIFALRRYSDDILFCPEVVNKRWLMDYYSTCRPTTPRRPSRVSQATPKRAPLTEQHKYNDIILITQQINLLLSRSGTQKYIARKQQLQEIVTLWKEDKDFMMTELLAEVVIKIACILFYRPSLK